MEPDTSPPTDQDGVRTASPGWWAPTHRDTENRLDGIPAVHPDLVDQPLRWILHRRCRPFRHRLGLPITRCRQLLWGRWSGVGLPFGLLLTDDGVQQVIDVVVSLDQAPLRGARWRWLIPVRGCARVRAQSAMPWAIAWAIAMIVICGLTSGHVGSTDASATHTPRTPRNRPSASTG